MMILRNGGETGKVDLEGWLELSLKML